MKKLILLCAVLAPLVVSSQGKEKKPVKGDPRVEAGVNWFGQVVRATGAGAPDLKSRNPAQARLGAERAALTDALRNLVAQVKGISVDGTRKMGDLMAADEVRTRVEGLVRGYKIVGKRYYSDGGVEIDIEVPLALLTDVVDPDATPVQLEAATPPARAPEKAAPPASTGLVIDARGLKVQPALSPKLLDDKGQALYSVDNLSAEARRTTGVASYVQSLEEAQKSMKAGDKPLVIKASRAMGADLQLAPEDALKLTAMNTSFLAEGKVVIVLN